MVPAQRILLCSDLDRTLIPNGIQEESAPARQVLRKIAAHPNVYLSYVSGRDKKLILDAIEAFDLPLPEYVIGDVGTTLYRIVNGNWHLSEDWRREISRDWKGLDWEQRAKIVADIKEIWLQEPEKQNQYKLSYYTQQNVDSKKLINDIQKRFTRHRIRVGIVWSVDEMDKVGLLDILPARANKLQAIQFLIRKEQFSQDRTVFAGDSGNDLDALTSGLQAILVNNAADAVRKAAIETLSEKQLTDRLYLPRGNFFGMNGNYAAGVLEGLAHFIPETGVLIAEALEQNKLSI
jgi:HAD superfamily hydrolase (TIGR01484 family)